MRNLMSKVSLYSAAAFALSAVPGFAQQASHLSVKVPFDFTAGMATLPAGDYDFQEQQNGVILISSVTQHRAVVVLTNPETSLGENAQPSVKFGKTGDQYSLTEVDLSGQPGRKIVKFDHEANSTSVAAKLGVTNAASKGLKK